MKQRDYFMIEDTPRQGSPAEALLRKAKEQYATISESLKRAEAKIKNGDQDEAKKVADLLRSHWKALQSTLELEIHLEKGDRERAGIVHGYALDLGAARTEVGRRMACLKAAGGN
ncbi:MAG: hypothetical protein ACI9ZD_002355 [Paracoccaceae bacterium]|jgi:hypothetical protein